MTGATIHFGKDFLDKVKKEADAAGLSLNAFLKEIAEKYLNGELVKVDQAIKGEPSEACIYGLKCLQDQKCPIRLQFPQLKKPEYATVLLKFCASCPFRQFEIGLLKKQASGASDLKQEVLKPKIEHKLPAITAKCDSCNMEFELLYYEEAIDPVYECEQAIRRHIRSQHMRDFFRPSEDVRQLLRNRITEAGVKNA